MSDEIKVKVKKININGQDYFLDLETNAIFDPSKKIPIGIWNEKTKSIDKEYNLTKDFIKYPNFWDYIKNFEFKISSVPDKNNDYILLDKDNHIVSKIFIDDYDSQRTFGLPYDLDIEHIFKDVPKVFANTFIGYYPSKKEKIGDNTKLSFPVYWNGTINVGEEDRKLYNVKTSTDLTKPVGIVEIEVKLDGDLNNDSYEYDQILNEEINNLKFKKSVMFDTDIIGDFLSKVTKIPKKEIAEILKQQKQKEKELKYEKKSKIKQEKELQNKVKQEERDKKEKEKIYLSELKLKDKEAKRLGYIDFKDKQLAEQKEKEKQEQLLKQKEEEEKQKQIKNKIASEKRKLTISKKEEEFQNKLKALKEDAEERAKKKKEIEDYKNSLDISVKYIEDNELKKASELLKSLFKKAPTNALNQEYIKIVKQFGDKKVKKGSGLGINNYSNPKVVQSKAKKYLGKDTLIQLSNKKDKKYMVYDPNTEKMIHFGQMGYEDFTKHKDENRRQRYLNRATKIKGNWKDNKYSPNNLSIHLLW
jgi:hypothetical protein